MSGTDQGDRAQNHPINGKNVYAYYRSHRGHDLSLAPVQT